MPTGESADRVNVREISADVKAVLASVKAFQQLADELHSSSRSLVEFKAQLDNMKANMVELNTIIRDDGRGGGLSFRITVMERQVVSLNEKVVSGIEELKNQIEKITTWQEGHDKACKTSNRSAEAARWKFIGMAVVAMIGLIGTVLGAILALKKGN